MSHEAPSQAALFDPDRLTVDGMPRDCPCCKGSGWVPVRSRNELLVAVPMETRCKNCRGTGRAIIPY